MKHVKILINRAPVLTLWASVVAERLGFDREEALTLGKALAGLNAQSKGRRLGIFKPTPKKSKEVREKERGEEFWVELLGRQLPAVNTNVGVRAVIESKPIDPGTVERYLESKFGDALPEARKAMTELANGADGAASQVTFGLFDGSNGEVGGQLFGIGLGVIGAGSAEAHELIDHLGGGHAEPGFVEFGGVGS